MPKRGINLHDNEVLRCFKTVNDAYIEPVSFIVPRRSEMFQSDIYPPTTGAKAGVSAAEWFAGQTALPPKISLESIYDGGAPQEVASDYKPLQPATTLPVPAKAETPSQPAPTPTPAPVTSRAPPPAIKDNKNALAAGASKFADKDDASDNGSVSSFEEVRKPVERPAVAAARQEEKKPSESVVAKPTPASTFMPSHAKSASSIAEPTSSSSATSASGGPAGALRDALGDIKSQLENQSKVMSDQSDQIALLVREVANLQTKLASQEPSDREKDERIRQLELELEEARS